MLSKEGMLRFWNEINSNISTDTTSSIFAVRSAGLCCSVGFNLEAAACAMRANMDHFQQSEFQTPQGNSILVARLDNIDIWGQERLTRWIVTAIAECLSKATGLDTAQVPLIWLAPELSRRVGGADWYQDILIQALTQLNMKFHPSSCILPLGRAGLATALKRAAELVDKTDDQSALLVGADTFLSSTIINAYLDAERLQIPGNSDGFIPGEAAAAVLLQKIENNGKKYEKQTEVQNVHVSGFGVGHEKGRPDGSYPSRAQGLTHAMRTALSMSGYNYSELDFRMSDQNGEAFFAREAANALTRLAPIGGQQLPMLSIADCLGEIGAATGPAMLAYLSRQMPHRASPGNCGLIHLANDDGLRCAVVLSRSTNKK